MSKEKICHTVNAPEKARDILKKARCTLRDSLLPTPHKNTQHNKTNCSVGDLNKNYPQASHLNDLPLSPTLWSSFQNWGPSSKSSNEKHYGLQKLGVSWEWLIQENYTLSAQAKRFSITRTTSIWSKVVSMTTSLKSYIWKKMYQTLSISNRESTNTWIREKYFVSVF